MKTKDLTKINGTYSKVLLDNKELIEKAYTSQDLKSFKKTVYDLVNENSASTPKQKEFLVKVMRSTSNYSLFMYCWNVIMKSLEVKSYK